jgi:hypothetical protein
MMEGVRNSRSVWITALEEKRNVGGPIKVGLAEEDFKWG